jgi:phosphocarrier protein FPr/phosphocarrier protein
MLELVAPLGGWCAPLEEAPDEVFASRMLGDGLLIDPTDAVLRAPCDAQVLTLPASRHAITLRAAHGVELLLHIGIDTVNLRGEGFDALVAAGAQVRAGTPLIRFDLDAIATRARSLVTPIVLTDGSRFAIDWRREAGPVRAGEPLMRLRDGGERVAAANRDADVGAAVVRLETRVALAHGVHARPAALLARRSREHASDIHLAAGGRSASARSAVALMSLGLRKGDLVIVEARGSDARSAAEAIVALLATAEAVRVDVVLPAVAPAPPVVNGMAPGAEEGRLSGVIASRGLSTGFATRLARPQVEARPEGLGAEFERAELVRARAEVRARLERACSEGAGPRAEILAAHLEFLDDPGIVDAADSIIARGRSAGAAWRDALRAAQAGLAALGDAHLAARVDDLADLESQVLLALDGDAHPPAIALPERAVVLADELLPSQLVALDAGRLAGICTMRGGATSHVAVLAAAMDVPMLVGLGTRLDTVADGTEVIVDAEAGLLIAKPGPAELATAAQAIARRRQLAAIAVAAAQDPCRTADGERIEVFSNIGSPQDAATAMRIGAEGCGLLRTEFLFLDRREPPGEDEQAACYQQILDAFRDRPVVIRLLDAGGDKPIVYLPMPPEPNPALGLRGIRASFWRPGLLRAQLRAILACRPRERCRLLLPMITDAAEVRAVRAMLDEEAGAFPGARIALGVMIETPAAAMLADALAREADFLSVGTNDLTQYTLAMDRTHPDLAARADALHPAVLRLIARVGDAAHAHGKPLAVCGGAASDLPAIPILIGLGVRELSAVPAIVPRLKARVRALDLAGCRALARRALDADDARAVRVLAAQFTGEGA